MTQRLVEAELGQAFTLNDVVPKHSALVLMAISLVASTRGLALMGAHVKNLLPKSLVRRQLKSETPTIDSVMAR